MEERTRLGLNPLYFAAIIYFISYYGLTSLILVTGFVLLLEKNLTVNKAAVKSLILYFAFDVSKKGFKLEQIVR